MLTLADFLRPAAAVATLAVMFSIPAAGQAPKLSTQQLNSPLMTPPKAYSPNLNKPISAPKALAIQHPTPDMKPRPMAHGSIASGTVKYTSPNGGRPGSSSYVKEGSATDRALNSDDGRNYGGISTGGPTGPDWTPPPNHGCPGGAEINPITGKCG
jgi:hypothetical protein